MRKLFGATLVLALIAFTACAGKTKENNQDVTTTKEEKKMFEKAEIHATIDLGMVIKTIEYNDFRFVISPGTNFRYYFYFKLATLLGVNDHAQIIAQKKI